MLESPAKLTYRNGENSKVGTISREDLQKEVDRAYLAGIIDGEGYIGMHIRRYYQSHPNPDARGRGFIDVTVQITNTDVRMIEKVSKILEKENIKFYYRLNKNMKTNQRPSIGICIHGQRNNYKLLSIILPHLANKKITARLVMEMLEYSKTRFIYGNRPQVITLKDEKLFEYERKIKEAINFRPDCLKISRKANKALKLQEPSESIRQTTDKVDDVLRSA